MNQFIFMGRLTRAPELTHTGAGKAVCNITIAVDGYNKTDFFDCVAFEQTAQNITTYFDKGKMILVSGEVRNNDWTDKNGSKRKGNEFIIRRFEFCGDKQKSEFEKIEEPDEELPF